MLKINKCYTDFIVLMPIAQSKRKLIAATALFIAVGSLTGAIATGGAATISYAQQGGDQGGAQDGQQGRIVRQGTITSSQNPLPGHEDEQRASILPLRQDGSIYTGVLTFTATEPVDVVILDMQNLNETERAIINGTNGDFGTLLTAQLNNQTSLVITTITPTYGDSPAPSASVPFAGSAVWLHTSDGTPFAASYAVSAQTQRAETMNAISNVTAPVTAPEAGGGGGDEGGDEAGGGGGDEGGGGGGDEAASAANGNATATDAGDTDGA
jgi:uncharacterized membrane protein YgcG